MGCKCANVGEEEEEIKKKGIENGNNEYTNNEYNKNFEQKEDLLGYNDNNNNKNTISINEINKLKNAEEKNANNNNNKGENFGSDPSAKYEDYPEKIVELINGIREDPAGYADVIEDSIQNIRVEEDKNDPSKTKLIFKKKVKVALNNGEPAFREAANILRALTPLPPLEFNSDLCIPLPDNEEELKDPQFLRERVKEIRQSIDIDVFFKDLVKVPEVSGLLMIVDDSNKNAGKKRMALLSKDLKYIGVTSRFIGKNFIAYFAFSK